MAGIKLTLYKGCILNDGYKNVFSQVKVNNSSKFDSYLNSLVKHIIEIDEVYQEDNTSFNFYLHDEEYGDIYQYNYMKIESYNDENLVVLTRYAFINSIKICNDIGVINYKIDIWHSFSNDIIGINKSYLKGLRVINGLNGLIQPTFYNLPLDYEGNNTVVIGNKTYSKTDECIVVVEAQYYDAKEYGNASHSDVRYIFIRNYFTFTTRNESGVIIGDIATSRHITFDDLDTLLERLINWKHGKNFAPNYFEIYNYISFLNEYYYDIGNIYIIPALDFSEIFSSSLIGSAIIGGIPETGFNGYGYGGNVAYHENNLYDLVEVYSETFINNFKRISIGFLNAQIPCINNGTTISLKILASVSKLGFKLFLNTMNKLIDITDLFKLEIPFTQLNGDVVAQQKISREMQNKNNIFELINNITLQSIHGANGFGSFGRGNVNYNRGLLANDLDIGQGRISSGAFSPSSMGYIASGITGMISGGTGIGAAVINTGVSLGKFFEKRKMINAPVYNTSSIVLANDIAISNAMYWITSIVINSDNDNFVKETINNLGYNVYEYLDDISKLCLKSLPDTFLHNNVKYNIIQFGTSDVYGNFPLNIKKALDNILENGIKFWYSDTIENDTYVVG